MSKRVNNKKGNHGKHRRHRSHLTRVRSRSPHPSDFVRTLLDVLRGGWQR